jgi:hypothetical protein
LTARPDAWKTSCCAGGGTDPRPAPPAVGRAPGGSARLPEIPSQETRVEAPCGGRPVADGRFPSPPQVTTGLILHLWDVDGRQGPRAPQAGQCDGLSAVGCDPIPGLVGDAGGGDNPAARALCRASARQPGATRPRFIDTDERRTVGWSPPAALSEVARSRTTIPTGDDLGVMGVGDGGDGAGLLVDLHSDGKRARWVHG